MVEINYYSKYLKYKQKYLKQKNLQIGGENISIEIKIEYKPLNKDIDINNWFINCDEENIIGNEIQKFLMEKNLMHDAYELQYKKDEDWINIDITKTFKQLNIKKGKIKIILEI
jgi:hypothetical protein